MILARRIRAEEALRPWGRATAALLRITVLALCLTAPIVAIAQPADDLQKIEAKISQQRAESDALAQTERTATEDINDLKKRLVSATSALQNKQDEQDNLEDRLRDLEDEMASGKQKLIATRARLVTLTNAMLRLSREPPVAFILRDSVTDDAIHRAILLRSLLPKLQSEVSGIAHDLEDMENLKQKAAEQNNLVEAARQNLESRRGELDKMVQERQGLVQQTAAEKAAIARQLEALSAEAADLRQLVDKVSQTRWPAAPASPNLHQGIKLPVAGKIVRGFGAKDGYGVSSQGLVFSAAPNSPVVAPQDGRVVFAGPFKGYGKIVILQHAGGYHSFLSGFERIDANMGQTVEAGEPLGVLAGNGASRPEFYFEWRFHNEPVDPMTNDVSQRASQR